MLEFILTTLITAVSLLAVSFVIPGVAVASFWAATFAAVSIGFVNGWIKPILFILSLPVNILSLGLFSLVINGVCFWLASLFVPGFAVHGFLALTFGPLILSAVNAFISRYLAAKGIGPSATMAIADMMSDAMPNAMPNAMADVTPKSPAPLTNESYIVVEATEI